jgi:hypothetical protein
MNALTTSMSARALRQLLVGVALAMAMAACSSSTGAGTGTGVTTTTGPVASTATGNEAAGVIDVCAAISPADLDTIFDGGATGTAEAGLTGMASGCSFVSKKFPDDEGIAIEVVTGPDAATFWTGNTTGANGDDTIPVSGIGDQAMRAPGTADFVSIKGSIFCEAETGSGNTEVYLGVVAPDASNNLPDDAANFFAQRVGKLCNDVFANH